MRRAQIRWRTDTGATAVEYALILGLIALVVAAAAATLGGIIVGFFTDFMDLLNSLIG